jgi:hypothetical protein
MDYKEPYEDDEEENSNWLEAGWALVLVAVLIILGSVFSVFVEKWIKDERIRQGRGKAQIGQEISKLAAERVVESRERGESRESKAVSKGSLRAVSSSSSNRNASSSAYSDSSSVCRYSFVGSSRSNSSFIVRS